jgi:hypothetical protein
VFDTPEKLQADEIAGQIAATTEQFAVSWNWFQLTANSSVAPS